VSGAAKTINNNNKKNTIKEIKETKGNTNNWGG